MKQKGIKGPYEPQLQSQPPPTITRTRVSFFYNVSSGDVDQVERMSLFKTVGRFFYINYSVIFDPHQIRDVAKCFTYIFIDGYLIEDNNKCRYTRQQLIFFVIQW